LKITIIAGARPNFVKIASIIKAIELKISEGVSLYYRLVHTGQHYDANMSESFFQQLEIPEPHINLECSGGRVIQQTAAIMLEFEKELTKNPTDLVVVVGDVNSTIACTLVAKQLKIKVAHVEGGIRSNDFSMPEEINRKVTDSIADYFFTTSKTANKNLLKEGVPAEKIFFVGNTMIDTLIQHKSKFKKPVLFERNQLNERKYIVVTLHRPENVDDTQKLKSILGMIMENAIQLPIVFPVHPRTLSKLNQLELDKNNLIVCEPLSYLEFNYLVEHSKMVITDSGGITEETTFMGVPCITLRNSTERPETCTIGTNELVGTNPNKLSKAMKKVLENKWKKGAIPELWDGKAAERIVEVIINQIGNESN